MLWIYFVNMGQILGLVERRIDSVNDGDLWTLVALYNNGIDIDFNNNAILRSACYGGPDGLLCGFCYTLLE